MRYGKSADFESKLRWILLAGQIFSLIFDADFVTAPFFILKKDEERVPSPISE